MGLRKEHEGGFSLIELTMAMVVTLIVTGAMYGLLAGGQNAFQREPELTDRQQNIRVAMDLIMRDVAAAGAAMPSFIQTFTPKLDGANFAACAECPLGSSGVKADEIEIMSNPLGLASEASCNYPGGSASHAFMASNTTRLQNGNVVMVLLSDGRWTMRSLTDAPNLTSTSSGNCDTSTAGHLSAPFNSGAADKTGYNLSGGICSGTQVTDATGVCIGCTDKGVLVPGNACCPGTCIVEGFLQGEIIRYRIRNGADGVPNLERFSSGLSSNFGAGGTRVYQVVARGIEDLQAVYTNANAVQTDDAPQVDQNQLNYGTLIRGVTVTLSARSEARNVAGAQKAAAGVRDALRGRLTSTGTPRAVLDVLATEASQRKTNWTGPTWY